MNKINPLYLLLFFTAVAVMMVVAVVHKRQSVTELSQRNSLLEQEGRTIAQLRSQWSDSKASKGRIEHILALKRYRAKLSKKEERKGRIVLVFEALDKQELDSITNAFLNEYLRIQSIEIERFSDKNATLQMELSL